MYTAFERFAMVMVVTLIGLAVIAASEFEVIHFAICIASAFIMNSMLPDDFELFCRKMDED